MSTLKTEDREFLEGFIKSPSSTCHGWDWWSWTHTFPGPRIGRGGKMLTQCRVFAFENQTTGARFKYFAGVWRRWGGQVGGVW